MSAEVPKMTYSEYRLHMIAAAERWERIAEMRRTLGDLSGAHTASDHATRCRYLAEDDPEVRDLFDGASS